MPHGLVRQVAEEITNTPWNIQAHPPWSCYFHCMISPIRGNRTGSVFKSPLGHQNR